MWAKSFKRMCSLEYQKALKLAMSKDAVFYVYKTKEVMNGRSWAISPTPFGDFWMDCLRTKKAAVALCKRMGWKIGNL